MVMADIGCILWLWVVVDGYGWYCLYWIFMVDLGFTGWCKLFWMVMVDIDWWKLYWKILINVGYIGARLPFVEVSVTIISLD